MTISDIQPKIDARAAENAPAVVVYSRPECVQCDRTKALMNREGIPFNEVNVDEDETAKAFVKGLDYMTAPVVYVQWGGDMGASHWGGFRPDLIKSIKEKAA